MLQIFALFSNFSQDHYQNDSLPLEITIYCNMNICCSIKVMKRSDSLWNAY